MQIEGKQDIRIYKTKLREKYKDLRKNMLKEKKDYCDNMIFEKIKASRVYQESSLMLTYVSTNIEVDTIRLIEYSLKQSKVVAVPKCISGTRNMKFHIIKSLDDLELATFSVLEPRLDICTELKVFDDSFCIVPGLAYDINGYRLGYGKGYYDRFLDNIPSIKKVGICYCSCVVNNLIKGRFDIPVDILITEKYTRILGGCNE